MMYGSPLANWNGVIYALIREEIRPADDEQKLDSRRELRVQLQQRVEEYRQQQAAMTQAKAQSKTAALAQAAP